MLGISLQWLRSPHHSDNTTVGSKSATAVPTTADRVSGGALMWARAGKEGGGEGVG